MLHNERAAPPSDYITGYPRILVIGRTAVCEFLTGKISPLAKLGKFTALNHQR